MSESAPCPLCREAETEVLGRRSKFGDLSVYRVTLGDVTRWDRLIVRCTTCGLQFVWPSYDGADITQLYRDTDYLGFLSSRIPKRFAAHDVATWCAEIERLGVLQRLGKGASCLDLGCGFGKGMYVFRELGFDVQGVDLNVDQVAHARSQFGLDARVLELERVGDLGRRFDCVTSSHVIEHVGDPHAFVETAASVLSPNGVLVLETPITIDFGDLTQRYTDVYHTLFFDHFTLGLLMQLHGFQAIGMHNLSFYLPTDWSENIFVQAAYVRDDAARPTLSAAQIRALRASYDGLAHDALRWARADLRLRLPRQALTKRFWHLGGSRFAAVRPRRLVLAARFLRSRLQTVAGVSRTAGPR